MQSLDALTRRLRKDQSTWYHDRQRADYLLNELLGELAYTHMQAGFVPQPPPNSAFANRPVPQPAANVRGVSSFTQSQLDAIAAALQAEQDLRNNMQGAARQNVQAGLRGQAREARAGEARGSDDARADRAAGVPLRAGNPQQAARDARTADRAQRVREQQDVGRVRAFRRPDDPAPPALRDAPRDHVPRQSGEDFGRRSERIAAQRTLRRDGDHSARQERISSLRNNAS